MTGVAGERFAPEPAAATAADRRLGARDHLVLWGSLGVGLLVIETGTFVAELGLARAVLAVAVGSVIGSALLAAAARIGAAERLPSMMLLRPVLGRRGSLVPTALNVLQLVGWTAFELWVMGHAAAVIGRALFGHGGAGVWIVVFALWSTAMALGGPLAVVRVWLEKVGVWAMLAASLYLTYRLASSVDLGALWSQAGTAPGGFWRMVDLVIVMPVSWLPLVADYSRFATSPQASFRGTFAGYALANTWFYLLGVLFVLSADLGPAPSPADLAAAIAALGGGALALVAILVDETDNVFADIYSAAVSIRNALPGADQRVLVVGLGALGAVLAAVARMDAYFDFLVLIGSVFVPLFGVLLADHYIVGRGAGYGGGAPDADGGVRWGAMLAWAVGVAAYHGAAAALPIGGSLPALAAAGGAYVALARAGLAGPARSPAVDDVRGGSR